MQRDDFNKIIAYEVKTEIYGPIWACRKFSFNRQSTPCLCWKLMNWLAQPGRVNILYRHQSALLQLTEGCKDAQFACWVRQSRGLLYNRAKFHAASSDFLWAIFLLRWSRKANCRLHRLIPNRFRKNLTGSSVLLPSNTSGNILQRRHLVILSGIY